MNPLYRGKVLRIYNSLYNVLEDNTKQIIICHKQKKVKNVVVGDNVKYEQLADTGNIISIEDRNNCLLKPVVSNIDQVFVMVSAKYPAISYYQIDSFLTFFNDATVNPIILFNKMDLVDADYKNTTKHYESLGYECYWICAEKLSDKMHEFILTKVAGKTVVFAGHSGVGKSTLIKKLFPEADILIGDISERLQRGKQTTKQTSLYYIKETNSFLADTPGFSQVDISVFPKEEIKNKFFEFQTYSDQCRFNNCNHLKEPNCAIKEALADKKIHQSRYDSYCKMIEQVDKYKKR